MEFQYDRYWELPYCYVLEAVRKANDLRYKELHENEVPIAMITYQQAEMNRDHKKQKKPHDLNQFFCYPDIDTQDSIDEDYGCAAQKLIEMGLFPVWALFIYKDLMKNAVPGKAPNVLCYQSEEAIILAPRIRDATCHGMLIAQESASSRVLTMATPDGDTLRIRMPQVRNKVIATENCALDIVT